MFWELAIEENAVYENEEGKIAHELHVQRPGRSHLESWFLRSVGRAS